MGCGGSVYAEDGTIKPGKGEARVEIDESVPLQAYFHADFPSTTQLKQLPVPGKSKEEQKNCGKYLSDGASPGSQGGTWFPINANTPYEQRYVANGGFAAKYKGAPVVDVCKRLGAQHAKEPEKLQKKVKQLHEKIKEHPYNGEGGENFIKEDLAQLDKVKGAKDLPDRLDKFKEFVKGIEDAIPQNHFLFEASCRADAGYWDVGDDGATFARQLSAIEKGRVMAEAKALTPENVLKILLKKNDAQRTAFSSALLGACKAIGVEVKDVVPNSDDGFDESVGRRNGFAAQATARAPAEPPKEVKEDEAEKARVEIVKKQVEADAGNLQRWKAEDGNSVDARKAALEKKVAESFKALEALSQKAGASGTYVAARPLGKLGIYEAKKSGGNYQWVDTKFDVGVTETVSDSGKRTVVDPVSGAEAEQNVTNVFELAPNVAIKDLVLGDRVRIVVKDEFLTGTVIGISSDNSSVRVIDATTEIFTVDAKSIWLDTTVHSIVTRPHVLLPNAPLVAFWWVGAEDDAVGERAVRVWREESKDNTFVTATLEKQYKTDDKGTKIFRGYLAKVPILPHRNYCYNFKIGDKTFVDWEKPAKNEGAYKRFQLRTGA